MAWHRPYNVIIAGVGGQGVFSLTRVIWKLCARAGMRCEGSTFKGGAQTLGSIHSVLRLFSPCGEGPAIYSTQVLPGDLDLMVGLEAWETLRYRAHFGPRTRIYMNTHVSPLLLARYQVSELRDPEELIAEYGRPLVARDYTRAAVGEFGSWKMANFVIGRDMAQAGALPFEPQEFARGFADSMRLDPRIEGLVMGQGPRS